MKIALTQLQQRIAPLFDSATTLVLYETIGYGKDLHYVGDFACNGKAEETIETLTQMNVQVLICGAISNEYEQLLLLKHIDLYSYIAGNVDEVLQGWQQSKLHARYFSMPGCLTPRHCSHRFSLQGCRGKSRRRDE